MSEKAQSVRVVPCPTCRTSVRWTPDNHWRPFCSERCKLIDLGAWASENYRVADAEPPPSNERDPNADG